MKSITRNVLIVAVAALGLSSVTWAGNHYNNSPFYDAPRDGKKYKRPGRNDSRFTDKVQKRQENQRNRIDKGRDKGQLTRKEKRRLRADQKEVKKLMRKYGKDGRYTREERRIINNAQDRAGKHIKRYRHNKAYPGNNNYPRYKGKRYDNYGWYGRYPGYYKHDRYDGGYRYPADRIRHDFDPFYWLDY